MGLVIEFGLPPLRPKRRKSDRHCEVTIFPGPLPGRRPVAADVVRTRETAVAVRQAAVRETDAT